MEIKKKLPRLALVHDWRGRAESGNPQPVELRVSMNGQRKYFPTGVKIMPCHWKDGQVYNRADMATLNERLSVCLRRANAYITSCLEKGQPIEWSGFQNIYNDIIDEEEDKSTDFFEFCIERSKARPVGEGTKKRYDVFLRNLEDFGLIMSFADLTVENVMKYNEWLHAKGLQTNTIYSTYHKNLKVFIEDAIRMGKLDSSPYKKLPKGYIKRGEKENTEYLTEDELARLEAVELPSDFLRKVRDLFLFQCYTGISYSDLLNFCLLDYQEVKGVYVFTGQRKKTKIKFTSVLLPEALSIAKKYVDSNGKLPLMCNTDYNKALKTVAALAGIRKRVHSHLARHTFATRQLGRGVAVENVARMMGHATLRQTQHYAKVLEENIVNDVVSHQEKKKKSSRAGARVKKKQKK